MRPGHGDSRTRYDRDPSDGGYGRQPGYAPEPARVQTPNWRWWIPAEGISRDVIQADIQRYLGPEALVRPGEGTEQYAGVPGYWIAAYRTLTASMIQDLKADSANWQRERGQSGARYEDSRVRESRQYWGPSENQAAGNRDPNPYAPAPAQNYQADASAYRRQPVYQQTAQTQSGYSSQQVPQQQQQQQPADQNYYHQAGYGAQAGYAQVDNRSTPRSAETQNQYQVYGQQTQQTPQGYGQASARTARPGYYIASDGNEYPLSALQR